MNDSRTQDGAPGAVHQHLSNGNAYVMGFVVRALIEAHPDPEGVLLAFAKHLPALEKLAADPAPDEQARLMRGGLRTALEHWTRTIEQAARRSGP